MSIGYVICIAAVILVLAMCVRSIVKDHRRESGSSCSGCGGSCGSSCSGCSGCGNDGDIIITVKRKKV